MAKVREDITMVDISTFLPDITSKLNERDRRIFLGAFSAVMGYGGVKTVSRLSGVAETTIRRGMKELSDPSYFQDNRIRAPGGGRKSAVALNPDLKVWIQEIVERGTYSESMNPERVRTAMSLRDIAKAVYAEHQVSVSHVTVGNILEDLGYRNQKKMLQGRADDSEKGSVASVSPIQGECL